MLDKIIEWFPEDEFIRLDGLDEAIIGVDDTKMRLIYSVSKCVETLSKSMEMDEEEALDYFHYNVKSLYVGEKTPIFCIDDL
jgi:hypothetical protein